MMEFAPGELTMHFASGEAMMAFDSALRVLAWNAAAEELTGIPERDAVGRFCWEVLGAADDCGSIACHAGCSYGRLAREGWPVPTRELWIRTREGKQRVSVATVAVNGGAAPVFLHLLRNGEETAKRRKPPPARVPSLTPRQREILGYLAEGKPAKTIAAELGLSVVTVRNHIRPILSSLGCHSQLEAVAKARRLGLIS